MSEYILLELNLHINQSVIMYEIFVNFANFFIFCLTYVIILEKGGHTFSCPQLDMGGGL